MNFETFSAALYPTIKESQNIFRGSEEQDKKS